MKTLRKQLGLTQGQLAEAARTNQSDISRIERGETEVTPDDAKRSRIAKALGTTVDDIYEGAGAEPVAAEGPTLRREESDQSQADVHAIFEAAILRAGANERGAWAPDGWELLPEHVERGVVSGVRASNKVQRVRWGGTAWPCEALGDGGVVILGETDEMR